VRPMLPRAVRGIGLVQPYVLERSRA